MKKNLLILIGCILVLPFTTNSQATLKAHYKFDETSGTVAVDASGNGFDADITGTTNWVDGTIGGALEFGGDAAVTIPASTMFLNSFYGSVSFWVNVIVPTGESSGIRTIFWAGDNTTGSGFGPENELHVHLEQGGSSSWLGGECSYVVADAEGTAFLFSDPDKGTSPGNPPVNPILIGDTAWHHIVCTFSSLKTQLYIDGEFISETDNRPNSFAFTHIFLGQMAYGGRTFDGKLDDVRIFSGVLTEEEITSLYNITSIWDIQEANSKFALYENYPNPFSETTAISYQLTENSDVLLSIYNHSGQLVRTLVNENQLPGLQSINWDGRDEAGKRLSPGIYLYNIVVNDKSQTKKLMLIK